MQQEHQAAVEGLEQAMGMLTQQSEQLAASQQEVQSLQQLIAATDQTLTDSMQALVDAQQGNAGGLEDSVLICGGQCCVHMHCMIQSISGRIAP